MIVIFVKRISVLYRITYIIYHLWSLSGGGTLPMQCNPTSSAKKKQPLAPPKPPKVLNPK